MPRKIYITTITSLLKVNRKVLIFLPLFLIGISLITWRLIAYGQQRTLEYQAIGIAEIIARQAASARSVYFRYIVGKLRKDGFGAHIQSEDNKGFVPLPAQFLKLFGSEASADSDELFHYKPISKWNLEPSQGLDDDFKRWAWSELEKQDVANPSQAINWQPVWRFEQIGRFTTLRYLQADPASADSCVNCHNSYEKTPKVIKMRQLNGQKTGKQWNKHQLLGAIQVTIPLDKIEQIASRQTNITALIIIIIFGGGLLAITFFVIRDLLRTQRVAHEMTWHVNHDTLTGLASRLAFENRIKELLARCRIDNSAHALLFMDLDQFKIVNDTCGHSAGDELLCELAKEMKKHVRSNDMLARLGGDEFGVLLESCDMDNAYNCAEKLRMAIRNFKFSRGKRTFEIGISIGLVPLNNNADDIASLLSLADLACYAAKDEGRNRIHVYSDSDTQVNIRQTEMDWASRFNRAIENNRLRLAVQYSSSLNPKNHCQHYSEILLRMIDEHGKPMPIAGFISAAERYHFMPTIDRWVVKSVLSMIRNGKLPMRENEVIAINLSGLSISENEFLDYVREQFHKYNEVPPSRICFEITETAAIGNISSAQYFIETLREHGCLFALDDFGSGLSSFSYLKSLPIDFLKIEGSFVRDMLNEPLDMVVVEAVGRIGKRIDMLTIAEWVENDETLEAVKSIGIDYAQGFGIHKPTIIEINENPNNFDSILDT